MFAQKWRFLLKVLLFQQEKDNNRKALVINAIKTLVSTKNGKIFAESFRK
jgi:hypothetical protein